jgi:choline dehydrogenase-like flavoprotein
MSEHYDVIVIGSGAGGGTLFWSLANAGRKVLLLERGGYLPREKENWSPTEVWVKHRYRNGGPYLDRDGQPFNPKQHFYVGGNTKMYGAVLFRMRERDFGEVVHHGGVSPAWPLSYADFEPWYTKAEQLYQVHGRRGIDPLDPPASTDYPHPPVSNEPRMQMLWDDLEGQGLTPFPLPMGVLLDEQNPNLSPCIRCNTCDGYPCPTKGKADAQTICVEPALHFPNATLLTETRVLRLETQGRGGHSVGKVVVNRHGVHDEYTADLIAVSCGAINSAALLLESADDHHPNGLGNSSGLVGRNLMLHHNSALIAFSKTPNPTRFQKTLGINDYYFRDDEFGHPLGAIQMLGRQDVPSYDGPADGSKTAHPVEFWITTEDLPSAANRVTVEPNGQIRVSYWDTNAIAHERLLARWRDLLDTMQCHEEFCEAGHYGGGRNSIEGVSHQNGTARFGTDPATSVLDLDCRMHDLENLYVVDSSFFVSASAVNPTLTIIANALRVGEHINARLG